MMTTPVCAELRCPVCRSAVGCSPVCARCKADLTPVLKLVRSSFDLREDGRIAFLDGKYKRAIRLLKDSLRLQESPRARKLLLLARVLEKAGVPTS